jgi:hypothetical protein
MVVAVAATSRMVSVNMLVPVVSVSTHTIISSKPTSPPFSLLAPLFSGKGPGNINPRPSRTEETRRGIVGVCHWFLNHRVSLVLPVLFFEEPAELDPFTPQVTAKS